MVYFIPVPVYWHLFAMLDSNTTKYARTYNVRFIFCHSKLDIILRSFIEYMVTNQVHAMYSCSLAFPMGRLFTFHAKLDIHPKSRRPQRQRITWE